MVFAYTSRSLFKADRLTFGMHFVRHLQKEHVDDVAWEFFLGLHLEAAAGGGRGPAAPAWVPEAKASGVTALTTALPQLQVRGERQKPPPAASLPTKMSVFVWWSSMCVSPTAANEYAKISSCSSAHGLRFLWQLYP